MCFFGHFYFWNGLCPLYCGLLTLCIKLFSSYFCSKAIDYLKIVVELYSLFVLQTHVYPSFYLSFSQVVSTIVWRFGLYILLKRLKNLWVDLEKFNFIFNVLIIWNKYFNLMFLDFCSEGIHIFNYQETTTVKSYCHVVCPYSFFIHLSELLL